MENTEKRFCVVIEDVGDGNDLPHCVDTYETDTVFMVARGEGGSHIYAAGKFDINFDLSILDALRGFLGDDDKYRILMDLYDAHLSGGGSK